MGNGRKLTISRSERSLGSFTYGRDHHHHHHLDAPELHEEDVWSSMGDGAWDTRAAARIPRDDRRQPGGLSLAFDQNPSSPRILHQYRGGSSGGPRGRHVMATSAPVNVPDWSKIYRVDSVESMHDSDDGADERESEEIVPPHEYLAREYRKMAAKSVFEGAGRTLKGRDMRRVRDAVWSHTGFDG